MRLIALTFAALLLVSACNLNKTPETGGTPPTPASTQEVLPADTPTLLPELAATLGTPVGASAEATPVETTPTALGSNPAPTSALITPGTAFPTLASGENAQIDSPTEGASVSGPNLNLSGVVHNLPEDQFTLQVFDASGQALTNALPINLSNPNHVADVPWSASVTVANYSGAAQIRISAKSADGSDAVIGSVSVTITTSASIGTTNTPQPQPSGAGKSLGGILSPLNGSLLSGDPIRVTGTAGGIPDNQITLLLLDGTGTSSTARRSP